MQTTVPFGMISTAFEDGGAIPARFTCDGEDVSPDLSWRGAPDGTASFVLAVIDPDARDFVHWVAYDLTGSASGGLPEGISGSPDAPPQGRNDLGTVGYTGPCPPSGTHHYRFTLYALDRALELAGTPTLPDVQSAMDGHVLAQTTLTGTYSRR
jgi:Raf kinase inhibitor-like YbhB/YbcL family protein